MKKDDISQINIFSIDPINLIILNFAAIAFLLNHLHVKKEIKKEEDQFNRIGIHSESKSIEGDGRITKTAIILLCVSCSFALLCFLFHTNNIEMLTSISMCLFVVGTGIALIDIIHYLMAE